MGEFISIRPTRELMAVYKLISVYEVEQETDRTAVSERAFHYVLHLSEQEAAKVLPVASKIKFSSTELEVDVPTSFKVRITDENIYQSVCDVFRRVFPIKQVRNVFLLRTCVAAYYLFLKEKNKAVLNEVERQMNTGSENEERQLELVELWIRMLREGKETDAIGVISRQLIEWRDKHKREIERGGDEMEKILSLNVNCFAGKKCTGKPWKQADYKLKDKAEWTIDIVKKFLKENKEGVVILQEVPCRHCDKESGWAEETREIYQSFCKSFDDRQYKIIPPTNTKAEFVTLAIVNKELGWEREKDGFASKRESEDYKSRFVEIKNERLKTKILGVHMKSYDDKTSKDDKEAIEKFWKNFCSYVEEKSSELILVGDFNAYNGANSELREYYTRILDSGYADAIPENSVTYYPGKTYVDHILCPASQKCRGGVKDHEYSDHAIITTDMEFKLEEEEKRH